MTPDWRSKYDFVVSLCYTGNAKRVPPLDAELARVGLVPDVRTWNVPCPFERKLLAGVAASQDMKRHPGLLNSGLGHYRAVKTAYELGAGRVLVLEDDVRFLKDLDQLSEVVANAPETGVALYDLCGLNEKDGDWDERAAGFSERAVRGWTTVDNPLSLACYGMDRAAMEWFIECAELAFSGRAILKVVDQWLTEGMRKGRGVGLKLAWPLACVQVPVEGSKSNTGIGNGGWHSTYQHLKIDLSEYAV